MDLEVIEEPPEVTEADIYMDCAEADVENLSTPPKPPYPVLSTGRAPHLNVSPDTASLASQMSLPLEAGEQSVRMPVQVASDHISSVAISSSYLDQKPSSASPAALVNLSSKPQGGTHHGNPILTCIDSQVSRSSAQEEDEEEDIDVDTPYDGRLMIQSANRPSAYFSMISKPHVARKSTAKGSSKKALKSNSVAKKSTCGLNKMIPKVLQIAKKSTAKQRKGSKMYGMQTKGTSDVVPEHASRYSAPQPRTPARNGPDSVTNTQQEVTGYLTPPGSLPIARPRVLSAFIQTIPAEQASAEPSPPGHTPFSRSHSLASGSLSTKPCPKSKKPLPKPSLPSDAPKQQSPFRPSKPVQAKPAPKSKKRRASSTGTLPLNPSSLLSSSYKAIQKTAYRKGFLGRTPSDAIARRPRRSSGTGSESSASDASQASAPKKARLEEAQSELNVTMRLLEEKQQMLRSVEEQLASVTASLETMVENKKKLEARETKCRVGLVSLETAARPFDCSICTEAFQLALSCPKSFRQHSKDKPFQCKHCPAAFTSHVLLEDHIDWHISDRVTHNQKPHVKVVPHVRVSPMAAEGDSFKEGSGTDHSLSPDVTTRLSYPESAKKQETPPSSVQRSLVSPSSAQTRKASPDKQKSPTGRTLPTRLRPLADEQGTPVNTEKSVSGPSTNKARAYCHLCGKQFKYYCELTKHMKVHTSIYTCYYCRKCFSLKSAIIEHTAAEHKGRKVRVLCKFCWKQFPYLSYFERHITVHLRGQQNECSVCGKRYNWPKNLVKHMQEVHGEHHSVSALKAMLKTGDFRCIKCGKSFMKPTNLVLHDQAFHADSRKPEDENSAHLQSVGDRDTRQHSSERSSQQPGSGMSAEGLKVTATGSGLNNLHQKAHVYRQRIASKLSARTHKGAKKKKLFSCILCDSSMSTKKSFRNHIRRLHSEAYNSAKSVKKGGPFTCPSCGFVSSIYLRLYFHWLTMHPGLPFPDNAQPESQNSQSQARYKCEKCEAGFSDVKSASRHILCSHPFQRKGGYLKCGICPKRLLHSASMYRHIRFAHACFPGTDSGQAPVAKSSTKKASLQTGAVSQPPQTTRRKTLKKKLHSKFVAGKCKCRVCGKKLADRNTVHKHIRMHHPDVPVFQCSKCGAGFKYIKDYKWHQCSQPEVREDCRYRCLTCGMGFHIAREWTKHMQEHSLQGSGDNSDRQAATSSLTVSPPVKSEHLFRCVDCGDTFDEEEAWGQHTCADASSVMSQVEDDSSASFSVETASDTSETSALQTKVSVYGTVTCTVCSRTLSTSSIRKHYRNIHNMLYRVCRFCSMGFTNLRSYKKHLSEHQNSSQTAEGSKEGTASTETSENQQSEGSYVDKNWQVTLNEHTDESNRSPLLLKMKVEPGTLSEEDQTSVQCTVCLKMFSPLYIHKHMRQVHSIHVLQGREFGQTFSDQLQFDRHVLQHGEEVLAGHKQIASESGFNSPVTGDGSLESSGTISGTEVVKQLVNVRAAHPGLDGKATDAIPEALVVNVGGYAARSSNDQLAGPAVEEPADEHAETPAVQETCLSDHQEMVEDTASSPPENQTQTFDDGTTSADPEFVEEMIGLDGHGDEPEPGSLNAADGKEMAVSAQASEPAVEDAVHSDLEFPAETARSPPVDSDSDAVVQVVFDQEVTSEDYKLELQEDVTRSHAGSHFERENELKIAECVSPAFSDDIAGDAVADEDCSELLLELEKWTSSPAAGSGCGS